MFSDLGALEKRRVAVLNNFYLSRFVDQLGADVRDNPGASPFMALDLLSEKDLGRGIPHRYRYDAYLLQGLHELITWM